MNEYFCQNKQKIQSCLETKNRLNGGVQKEGVDRRWTALDVVVWCGGGEDHESDDLVVTVDRNFTDREGACWKIDPDGASWICRSACMATAHHIRECSEPTVPYRAHDRLRRNIPELGEIVDAVTE